MQALVYKLNRKLQTAFIEADLQYVNLLLNGGSGTLLGNQFDVIGLDGTAELLDAAAAVGAEDEDRRTSSTTRGWRSRSPATRSARPRTRSCSTRSPARGARSALSAQVQAYGLAITITFLGVLLAAGALAAERDENVIGRLVRGLVGLGQLVAAKVALAVTVALGLGLALLVGSGSRSRSADVTGGEPWQRLPLVLRRPRRSPAPRSARSAR